MTSHASHIEVRNAAPIGVQNILCLGRTYRAHAAELGNEVPKEPLVFLKSTRCLRPLASGPLAFGSESFHHEAEVVIAIGQEIPLGTAGAWDHVAAVGLGIDLTRRAHQTELKGRGHPWTTSKSFQGAALVTPFTPRSEIAEPDSISFTLDVDGERRQTGSTERLTHPIPALLSRLSSFVPLGPGDLVFTGTPEGVGPVERGARLVLESPQLGRFEGTL